MRRSTDVLTDLTNDHTDPLALGGKLLGPTTVL